MVQRDKVHYQLREGMAMTILRRDESIGANYDTGTRFADASGCTRGVSGGWEGKDEARVEWGGGGCVAIQFYGIHGMQHAEAYRKRK